jgi:hypothetical protein
MGNLSRLCKILRSAIFRHAIPCALTTFLLASTALAAPVTYTGFTITDGQLGSWTFANARVYLTFQTDTQYVRQTQIEGVDVSYVGFSPLNSCAQVLLLQLARRASLSLAVERRYKRHSHPTRFSSASITTMTG